MNKLLKAGSIAVLYAATNFFASNGFANPDRIAASLAEVADDTTSSAASAIVRARVEEDLAGLVSTVVLTGTAKDGAHSGKTLSEILSGTEIVDTSVFTSAQPASLRVLSCDLAPQDGQLDWRGVNHLNVSFCFNGMPSPDYTGTYTLEVPGVRASGGLTFRMDDMTPQLRDVFPRAIERSGTALTFQTSFSITPPRHVRSLLDAWTQPGQVEQKPAHIEDLDLEHASTEDLGRIAIQEIVALTTSLARTLETLRTVRPEDPNYAILQKLRQMLEQAVMIPTGADAAA